MNTLFTVETKLSVEDKLITQEHINQYAIASDDDNPLHINPEFAKTTMFGGTIAHGLLSAAFLNEMMIKYFGNNWETSGDISIAFLSPVRPGDVIKTTGTVIEASDQGHITMEIQCMNQNEKKVIAGQASVTIPAE